LFNLKKNTANINMNEVFQNIDSLQGLSLVLNGVFLGAIVYLYKRA